MQITEFIPELGKTLDIAAAYSIKAPEIARTSSLNVETARRCFTMSTRPSVGTYMRFVEAVNNVIQHRRSQIRKTQMTLREDR